MSSDTLIPVLSHLRFRAVPSEGGVLSQGLEFLGHIDQSQEQAAVLGSGTTSALAHSVAGRVQNPVFISYSRVDRDLALLAILHDRLSYLNESTANDWLKIQLAAAPPESRLVSRGETADIWEEDDEMRFDLLVGKELSATLTGSEREELEALNQRRDRTLAKVSHKEMERENLTEAALTELQRLIEKYAPLFAKRP